MICRSCNLFVFFFYELNLFGWVEFVWLYFSLVWFCIYSLCYIINSKLITILVSMIRVAFFKSVLFQLSLQNSDFVSCLCLWLQVWFIIWLNSQVCRQLNIHTNTVMAFTFIPLKSHLIHKKEPKALILVCRSFSSLSSRRRTQPPTPQISA